jgi:hypothetical protein
MAFQLVKQTVNFTSHHTHIAQLWRTAELQYQFCESMRVYFDHTEEDWSGEVYLIYRDNEDTPCGVTGWWEQSKRPDGKSVCGLRWTAIKKKQGEANSLQDVVDLLFKTVTEVDMGELFELTNTPEVVKCFIYAGFEIDSSEASKEKIASGLGDMEFCLVKQNPYSK